MVTFSSVIEKYVYAYRVMTQLRVNEADSDVIIGELLQKWGIKTLLHPATGRIWGWEATFRFFLKALIMLPLLQLL